MATPERIREFGSQYLSLQKALTESEWAISALPQISKRLQSTQTNVQATRDTVRRFEKSSNDQLERYQDLKHHSVKHVWYRTVGKLEKKIDEEEKAWLKEAEQIETAKARADEQEKRVVSAKKLYDECVEAKRVHESAQRELSALLDRLFDEPTSSFPSEDSIEESVTATRSQLNALHGQSARQAQVTSLLQKANDHLVGALQHLQASLSLNTYDMFSRGGMADMMVHSYLASARDLSARAQILLIEAQKLDPRIPHLGDLHIEQDNLVFQLVFDNIFTDLRMRQLIQQSFAKVSNATAVLQKHVLPAVVEKDKTLKAQVQSCRTQMRDLERKLWEERERLIVEVIGTERTDHRRLFEESLASRVEPEEEDDGPPPPYEA